MFDGQALDYAGVMKLEKMPTKLELVGTIARLIKQVRSRLERQLGSFTGTILFSLAPHHQHARCSQAVLPSLCADVND